MSIRVRFAPSPTGSLHIGTLRTAIFNWLFAKNQQGKFILRIEDTDLERSDKIYEASIFDGLSWLGLIPDEGPNEGGAFGPYRQSERIEAGIYQKYALDLLAKGQAYYCFCSDAELDEERKLADQKKISYVYSRKCQHLSPEQIEAKKAAGVPYTIKFFLQNQEKLVFNDLIKGKIEFDGALFSDFVIIKSNGTPSYNFAVVVDDYLMQITHVIRGEDHISNTIRQLGVFNALGASLPKFAHLPMILGPDKAKLSKRHGATSILEYKDRGYLPEAILNYLSLLGWSSPNGKEILSQAELIELFSLKKINKANAIFDLVKLNWLNGQYIRKLSKSELFLRVKPFIEPNFLINDVALESMVYSIREKLVLLTEVNQFLGVYFLSEVEYLAKIKSVEFSKEDIIVIKLFQEKLQKLASLNEVSLTALIKEIQVETQFKNSQIFHPVRLICTAMPTGPSIFEFCELVGKDLLLKRLALFWVGKL